MLSWVGQYWLARGTGALYSVVFGSVDAICGQQPFTLSIR